jgi:Rrf2 family protein
MLSQTIEYALRAALYIARSHPHSVQVMEIADATDAPRNYLAKILGQLARAGLLESTRGPTGGFRLSMHPDDVPLSRVVGVFDLTEQRRCLLGNGICGQNPSCTAHVRWEPIAQEMEQFFARTTLADLLSSPRILS